jgi:hypothetical protein
MRYDQIAQIFDRVDNESCLRLGTCLLFRSTTYGNYRPTSQILLYLLENVSVVIK